MLLVLAATALVALALLSDLIVPRVEEAWQRYRARRARPARYGGADAGPAGLQYDPGRERRAEQRARVLLRSCVNDEIETANMHLPGRQLDPAAVTRDLWRLKQWERARMRETPTAIT